MITAEQVVRLVKCRIGIEKDGREWLLEMMPKHAVCAEIGVFWGAFSRLILRITKPSELHLIDPWHYQPSLGDALYGGVSGSQQRMDTIHASVVRHLGKRANVRIHRATSLIAVSQFPDNYFDWLYVDGDHSYGGATADLVEYRRKLKPGGLIAGDDYARNPKGWMRDSVTRAVDDILANGMYECIELYPQTHQFVLRRPI
jgi:hypothetical protein